MWINSNSVGRYIRNFITLLFCIIANLCFAQNDKEFREDFTLKLSVDSVRFYQQDIKKSKYFIKDNTLQIYPGEHLFIEAEVKDDTILFMKTVKEIKNPSKTIEIEFTQKISDKINKGMTLKVSNPFNKNLMYDAMMYIVGKNEWIETSILPIKPKLRNFEMWNDAIITLLLDNWRLQK